MFNKIKLRWILFKIQKTKKNMCITIFVSYYYFYKKIKSLTYFFSLFNELTEFLKREMNFPQKYFLLIFVLFVSKFRKKGSSLRIKYVQNSESALFFVMFKYYFLKKWKKWCNYKCECMCVIVFLLKKLKARLSAKKVTKKYT